MTPSRFRHLDSIAEPIEIETSEPSVRIHDLPLCGRTATQCAQRSPNQSVDTRTQARDQGASRLIFRNAHTRGGRTQVTKRPAVTIVVPTRNRRDEVLQLVRSLSHQADIEVQLVVVVEGSTDGTLESLSRCGLSNLEVIYHPDPRGVSAARNAGLDRADADYIGFIDDDDFWSPTRTLDAIEAMTSDVRGAVWSSCTAANIDHHLTVSGFQPAPASDTTANDLRRRNLVPGGGSAVVAKTEAVRSVGGFSSDFADLADWDLWLRLIELTPMAVVPRCQIAYTFDLEAPSNTNVDRSIEELARLRVKHRFGVAGNADVDEGLWNRWVWSQYRRAHDRSGMGKQWMQEALRSHSPGALARAVGYRCLPFKTQAMIHRRLFRNSITKLDAAEVALVQRWLGEVAGDQVSSPR